MAFDKDGNNIGGRPTKWNAKLNDKLIKFFDIEEKWTTRVKSSGTTSESTELRAVQLPLFSIFEIRNGLSIGMLSKWAGDEKCEEERPGFFQAYKTAKELQKDFLIQCGLQGLYPPSSFIFTAKNITDMKDITRQELTKADGEDLFPESKVTDALREEYEKKLKQTLIK